MQKYGKLKTKIAQEQRELMLEFMMGHEDLARGRVAGADANRRKAALLRELADVLNGVGEGTSKSPEKWWKSWQDWKSDIKALKIKKCHSGTGGGPAPTPLTKLEESLLQFCGVEMVEGVSGVADPLDFELDPVTGELKNVCFSLYTESTVEEASDTLEMQREVPGRTQMLSQVSGSSQVLRSGLGNSQMPSEAETADQTPRQQSKQDPLLTSLDRQAVAIESLASIMQTGLADIAAVRFFYFYSINNNNV